MSTHRAAAPAGADLHVKLEKLRSERGKVHACLTQDRSRFPDCRSDPNAFRASAPAAEPQRLRFEDVPSGSYALAIVHDENANGQLDRFAKIPREGYGFSRNPPMRFGPPEFGEASFDLEPGRNVQVIRVKYLL